MARTKPATETHAAIGTDTSDNSSPRRGWHGDPEGHAAAGRKGGRAAHERGTAHRFSPEEAREAGRKGGRAAHRVGAAHRFTPEEARAAGAKGASSRFSAAD